ncbi:MAG: APC family permease [Chloroflexi bacterium]|nr:APC family permease [Chloroflexota bacterium]
MATEQAPGQPAGVFIRRSSGLTRQISAWDALMYCATTPGIAWPIVYAVWTPWLYPGAHMVWATLAVLLIYPIAALYWLFSVGMPRSGGEYVYVSRALHPVFGLMCSFTISFVSISWTAVGFFWFFHYAFAQGFRGLGLLYGGTFWPDAANFVDQQWFQFLGGTILLLFLGYIFTKGARWMMTVSWIAISAGIVCMLILGLSALFGANNFAANFTSMTGMDYNSVIPAATAAGYPTQFVVFATLAGGATYVGLNTLASTFSANIAGEVRGVQRSQLIALIGSLTIQLVLWALMYWFQYISLGGQWSNSLYYLAETGNKAYTLPAEPMMTMLIAVLTGSPIVTFLLFIAFALTAWGSLAGEAFGPTRNIFAWAFDRMIPPKFAEMGRRTRQPWLVLILTLAAVEAYYVIQIFEGAWMANVGYSILAWFAAWLLLGVAGMVFPFRKKDLFESMPPMVKARLGGLPVMTILGVLTFIISAFIVGLMLYIYYSTGGLPAAGALMAASFLIIPIFIYIASALYWRNKGVPISKQFEEVPPE